MTLDQLMDIFIESPREAWHTFKCQSKQYYPLRACYKNDLSIGLAWGLAHKECKDEWMEQLELTGPCNYTFITFLYNGMMVYQKKCIDITELCYFPVSKGGKGFFSVDRGEFNFIRHFNKIIGKLEDFEAYFTRSGIEIRD